MLVLTCPICQRVVPEPDEAAATQAVCPHCDAHIPRSAWSSLAQEMVVVADLPPAEAASTTDSSRIPLAVVVEEAGAPGAAPAEKPTEVDSLPPVRHPPAGGAAAAAAPPSAPRSAEPASVVRLVPEQLAFLRALLSVVALHGEPTAEELAVLKEHARHYRIKLRRSDLKSYRLDDIVGRITDPGQRRLLLDEMLRLAEADGELTEPERKLIEYLSLRWALPFPGVASWREPGSERVLDRKFKLKQRLGTGAFGTVWRAEHLFLQREVAIKLLNPERAQDPKFRENCIREARVLMSLQHPSIVQALDVGLTEDGHLYLVMELVQGESLRAILDRTHTLPFGTVVEIGACVLEALAHAHEHGVIHRDLKPENVLVGDWGGDRIGVKVLDFGIAKILASGETGPVQTMRGWGTPPYASPEQAAGQDVDLRADLYSVGVMLYEMCAGVEWEELVACTMVDPPPPIRRQRPDMPPWLEAAIAQALRKDRRKRPDNAEAMLRLLAPGLRPGGAAAGATAAGGGVRVALNRVAALANDLLRSTAGWFRGRASGPGPTPPSGGPAGPAPGSPPPQPPPRA